MYCMMAIDYGGLQANRSYEIVEEGKDWFSLKIRGRVIYVSKDFTVDDPISEVYSLRKEVSSAVDEEEDLFTFGGIL